MGVPILQSTDWLALGLLAVLLILPGSVAAVAWSPVLASERLRGLFRQLPPTRSAGANLGLAAVALSLPWVVGSIFALGTAPSGEDAAAANALLDVVVTLSAVYLVALPLVAGMGLPKAGFDWDSTGYGPGTWLLLFVGGAWYVATLAVPLFFFTLFAAMPT